MGVDTANLAALVGSRICHDLISPVGAINNGLELLGMSNSLEGPELELISDSVNNANARIRFFRVAFGAAGEQDLGRAEVISVLSDVSKGGRIKYNWSSEAPAPRREVRMAFLAVSAWKAPCPMVARFRFCAAVTAGPSLARGARSTWMKPSGRSSRSTRG